ncbi:MAG: PKD domain-containing protein, partial [candidate division WOR-3 bacterium]|nr:PKD domain-containing protein [candidate division WOR-3 bacterium]
DFQLYDSTTANEYVDTSVQEGTTYHYTIAAVASDSGASNSTGEVYATPGNTPPRIDSVVPANPVALWGDSVAITCYAFDNDGDSITYTWDAPDGGTISGEGQSIVFTVPQDTQMTHRVKVIVSDAYGTGDIDSSVVSSLLGWVRVDTSGPRRSAPIAYDSRRDRVVFFGGVDGQGFYDDTWEWDGQHWVRVSTQGPSPRVAGLLVYDEARGDVLMFGGYNGEGDQYLGETWVWDGVAWTQKVVSEPSSRNLCASAYDSGRQRVVLFGGTSHWMVSNETWEWDGTQWSLRSTTGPCSRFAAVMAYDKGSGKCVLFGGITDWDGSLLHDTWVWDGSTWTQVDTAGPPARIQGAMAYNESRGKTVLFGGTYVVSPPRSWFDDTWEWDGQKWIQVSSAESPSGRATFMTYQENLHRIVLYGGYDDNEFFHDLWAYR